MTIHLRAKGLPLEPRTFAPGQHKPEYFGGLFPSGAKKKIDGAWVTARARDYERIGYDSMLLPLASSSPDPWAISAWALAATDRLDFVSAHRVGTQSPTVTARQLATLDTLSGGRITIHIIQGNASDLARDGEFGDSAFRYRRTGEFLTILDAYLDAEAPLDFDGEFYRLKGAWSGIASARRPRPTISLSGASPEALTLAARHADIYGLYSLPLRKSRALIDTLRQQASGFGRTLRFWRDSNFILADTDDRAWALARRLTLDLENNVNIGAVSGPHALRKAPESTGHKMIVAAAGDAEVHDGALYTGISRIRGGWGPAFVGSPATAARAVLEHYKLGVELFSIGLPEHTPEDAELRDELMRLVREGATAIDAARTAESGAAISGAY
jgi:alkanesulfonate monooxygenase